MSGNRLVLAFFGLANLAACTTVPPTGVSAVEVFAAGETVPVRTVNEDAADDPAIWRDPANPAASLIVATDKKAGLYVYGLDGAIKGFSPHRALNNVDLVDMGAQGVIVFASDRSDLAQAKIALYRLNTQAGTLAELARLPSGAGEAYGICGTRRGGQLIIYTAPKSGEIGEWEVRLGADPMATRLRTMQVATQPEGCVVDHRDGTLYIGEEDRGIWRFARGETAGQLVAAVDGRHLVADLEGLALVPDGARGGWLYASSQGDNAYMRYALPEFTPAGRFRIAAGRFGSVEQTDGIEAMRGDFDPAFPSGLFVAQDGVNDGKAQNFKLVPLSAIEAALGD
ncbi:MAG: phytase [Erythrobacter sp.]|jgi:3-phytase